MKYLKFLIICGLSVVESFNPFTNIKNIVQNKVSEIKKRNFISVYDQNILEKLKTFSDQKYTIIDRKNNYLYDNFTSLVKLLQYFMTSFGVKSSPKTPLIPEIVIFIVQNQKGFLKTLSGIVQCLDSSAW